MGRRERKYMLRPSLSNLIRGIDTRRDLQLSGERRREEETCGRASGTCKTRQTFRLFLVFRLPPCMSVPDPRLLPPFSYKTNHSVACSRFPVPETIFNTNTSSSTRRHAFTLRVEFSAFDKARYERRVRVEAYQS